MSKPTMYLAGPMRGIQYYNFPAFQEAAAALRDAGWDVISPVDMDIIEDGIDAMQLPRDTDWDQAPAGLDYVTVMTRDLTAVCAAAAICVLPGWRHSAGARVEVQAAQVCGIPMYEYRDGLASVCLSGEHVGDPPLVPRAVIADIEDELLSARGAHPGWPTDIVHAAAVVGEEAGKLLQAALDFTYRRVSTNHLREEAVQTAAMAIRLLSMLEFGTPRRSAHINVNWLQWLPPLQTAEMADMCATKAQVLRGGLLDTLPAAEPTPSRSGITRLVRHFEEQSRRLRRLAAVEPNGEGADPDAR